MVLSVFSALIETIMGLGIVQSVTAHINPDTIRGGISNNLL